MVKDDKLVKVTDGIVDVAADFVRRIGETVDAVVPPDAPCTATRRNWLNQPYRCSLLQGHDGEHAAELDGRTYTWADDAQALALRTSFSPQRGEIITEGTHFGELRSVYYDTSINGEKLLVFRLSILKSRTMNPGEYTYVMKLDRAIQARMAAAQLNRLNLNAQAITRGRPNLSNANLDVIIIAMPKMTKMGRTIMTIDIRLDFAP